MLVLVRSVGAVRVVRAGVWGGGWWAHTQEMQPRVNAGEGGRGREDGEGGGACIWAVRAGKAPARPANCSGGEYTSRTHCNRKRLCRSKMATPHDLLVYRPLL